MNEPILATFALIVALGITAQWTAWRVGLPSILLSTLAARWLLGWDWAPATLIGTILTVTGPTVVMPLLRHIRPARQVGSILKWEGILIDPVGAVLAIRLSRWKDKRSLRWCGNPGAFNRTRKI